MILEDPKYINDMDAAVKEAKRILGEFSDNEDLKTITDKKDKALEFNSVEEVVSANLEPGTIVLVNGREARVD
jgi:predicted RNA-binding protein (virulence factor B family)